MRSRVSVGLMLIAAPLAIAQPSIEPPAAEVRVTPARDNAGITLPDGFRAMVFADNLGRARHAAIRDNGDMYVMLRRASGGGSIVALRDTDGDGQANVERRFGQHPGTGIEIRGDWLYVGGDMIVLRYRLPSDGLVPTEEPEILITGFPNSGGHNAKPLAFDADGHLYVNVGAPSNACQEQSRSPGSPGLEPCPQLEFSAGVWRYDPERQGQRHPDDGHRFATGLRNCVALTWRGDAAYAVPHGRDQLDTLFPAFYDAQDNADLPGEEFHRLTDASDAGWPYTYWNPEDNARIVAPEYGGDSVTIAEPGRFQDPIQTFPAHWGPNDLVFYDAEQFPERYRGGAFVAFHGSWNRAPEMQAGYNVTFTPFDGDDVAGDFEVFADGFVGDKPIRSPRQAKRRPTGLAVGPHGHLFIIDSVKGRVWRVFHEETE